MTNNQLKEFINRIERLESEKKAIAEDIKEIYSETKAFGYDAKIVRKIIAMRKMDPGKRAEEEALIETYLAALGQLADTPLGQSAMARATA